MKFLTYIFTVAGLLAAYQAHAEEKQILSCKSIKFDRAFNGGKEVTDPISVSVFFNREEEPNYRLLYEGPAYTLAAKPSQVELTSKTANVTLPMGTKGERLLNVAYVKGSAAQEFLFSVDATPFVLKGEKRAAYLRYRDGKPIAIDAELKCVKP